MEKEDKGTVSSVSRTVRKEATRYALCCTDVDEGWGCDWGCGDERAECLVWSGLFGRGVDLLVEDGGRRIHPAWGRGKM